MEYREMELNFARRIKLLIQQFNAAYPLQDIEPK